MYASMFSLFNSHRFSLSFSQLALVVTLLLSNALAVFAYDGEVDLSYAPKFLRAGTGTVIEQQADGKMLVAGLFSDVNGVQSHTYIIRINVDGTVDQSFSAYPLTGEARKLYLLPDGKILVGANGIFRLNPDGSRDETFVNGVGGTAAVYSISLQTDGKILVAAGTGVLRLNSDGTIDSSFHVVVENMSSGHIPFPPSPRIAALPDGKSLLYGLFSRVNGVAKAGLARLNNDGSLDSTFNPIFSSGISVNSLVLQADGKILVTGNFISVNGTPINNLARLNPDGSLDTSFSSVLSSGAIVINLKVRADGKIFVTGQYLTINSSYVIKLNVDGSIDTSFNANPNARINDILISENPVIVGQMDKVNGIQRLGIARLDAAGNVDANFAVYLASYGDIYKILALPDGKALVGGDFVRVGNSPTSNLVRINSDGTLDSSFNAAVTLGSLFNSRFELSAGSKIGVCCSSNIISTGAFKRVAILNYDGSLDTSFDYTLGGTVNDMAFFQNGKVLIAAYFGAGNSTVVILNADGTRDTSFMPVFSAAAMYGVAVQNDGKFYALGNFTTVNGIPRRGIVRFNADGSVDQTFNPNLSISPQKILIQPDGKLLVFGNYKLIRLNADGSLDSSFATPDLWLFEDQFVVQPDGRILILLLLQDKVVRLKPNGRFDYSFNFNATGTTSSIEAIAIQPDNRILAGGIFDTYNNIPRYGMVRLENAMLAPPTIFDFDVDGKSDLAVFRPSDTSWHILKSSNNTYSATPFGLPDDKLVPGDYDLDGITDFAVFRPSEGRWYILNSLTNQVSTMRFGQSGDIPVPADYNGDARIDFAVYRPSTGVWWLALSDGRFNRNITVTAIPFGAAGDIPTIGDFDGDGKSDIAVWRPSNGIWYRLNSSTNQLFAYQLGVEGDKPTPADYDGDSKIDISVYRPSNGTWYRVNSADNSLTIVRYGLEEDRPVPADYDGDGKTDIAVYRPSTGVWYQLRSTQGSNAQPFGLSGDLPIQNAFVP